MFARPSFFFLSIVLLATLSALRSNAFVVTPSASSLTTTTTTSSATALHVFGKKKKEEEDLSFIETRDMTPEEMQRYNKRSEDIVQGELWGMTIFSLILSIPMLYLVWVGFFSETAEMVDTF